MNNGYKLFDNLRKCKKYDLFVNVHNVFKKVLINQNKTMTNIVNQIKNEM